MPMHNLLDYSDNYSKMFGGLQPYYRDEINYSDYENNNANNYRINTKETTTSKSFDYKTKITETTPNDNNILDAEVVVPLKYLSNFWRHEMDKKSNNI